MVAGDASAFAIPLNHHNQRCVPHNGSLAWELHMGRHYSGLLTPQQSLILELLTARFGLRSEEIAQGLYGKYVPSGANNTIAVQLNKLRTVLEPYGIEIVTYERFGVGPGRYRYSIPLRCRPALKTLIAHQLGKKPAP